MRACYSAITALRTNDHTRRIASTMTLRTNDHTRRIASTMTPQLAGEGAISSPWHREEAYSIGIPQTVIKDRPQSFPGLAKEQLTPFPILLKLLSQDDPKHSVCSPYHCCSCVAVPNRGFLANLQQFRLRKASTTLCKALNSL
jgi:hypothetical protein